ncbi:MAG TPA: OmpH family outer membrane protein [Candidatus Methylacidiphilales bacterium]|nr:OmpH family outer membrane protein [Candidatus Methylacidiphilales bacterium]
MNKLLLLALLIFAPVSMASADLKVAVIDLNRAFDAYYKTKDANARLKEKAQAAQKDITDLMSQYQNEADEAQHLSDAANDPTLSAQARQEKAAALKEKQQDLYTLENRINETKLERERELEDEKMRRHKEILDEITKVINDYSGPQGFDLVVDKSGVSAASALPVVVFSSNKLIDITDVIIQQLNASAPPASAGTATTSTTSLPATH